MKWEHPLLISVFRHKLDNFQVINWNGLGLQFTSLIAFYKLITRFYITDMRLKDGNC